MFRIVSSIFICSIFWGKAFAETPPPPIGDNKPAAIANPQSQTQNEKVTVTKSKPTSQARIDAKQYEEVISEYKKYLATIPSPIRDEIREYRKEVIRINKEKVQLYKKLSVEAQNFLKKEREFKQKLPIKQRKKVTQATVKQN